MIPACPKSRATVSDGCAPTLSQYLFCFRRAISGQSRRANATKTWERTKKRTRGVLESGWERTGGDALGTVDLQAHVFVPVDLCRWRGMPGKVGQSGATEGGGRARDGRAANVSG